MAINETELDISNKSYINKDFQSIFNELMDIATKISDRFNPADTNESDPFIVLLKLLAFVGDKVCYNVDKNILERFILSCTQDKSMRELTEMLGYNMHYYRAASTNVSFAYDFKDTELKSITIPQYSILVDKDDTIQYITTSQTMIDSTTKNSQKVEVLQGILKTLDVLGSESIQLENLDANNRLYFPEPMVAENGVFITGGTEDEWTAVTNLNTQEYNSACFKFSFDSTRNLPYIQFPDWIINIIGNGLNVKYLITDGELGNIKAKTLIQVQRNKSDVYITDDIDDSTITVINSESATNGTGMETIDEAYQGFQRTIGTFDTLVTCRDYANAIYQALDNNNNNLVSNIQVSDRRNDINYSSNVMTYTDDGVVYKNIIEKDDEDKDIITPFEICLYPFKYSKDVSFSVINQADKYNETFTRLKNTGKLQDYVETSKTASHDYKQLDDNDIFAVKNYYKLSAIISTTSKVNAIEQRDIIYNVNNALALKYNSRNLTFGSELAYDDILTTIENSDSRIKSVSLYEPEVTPVFYKADNTEIGIEDENQITDEFKTIICKNILSGKVSMFKYDNRFDYRFGQTKVIDINMLNDNINNVTTKTNIGTIQNEYTLNNNEVVQLVSTNYITDVTYPYGVNYYLELVGNDYIPINAEYKLKANETFVVQYVDENDKNVIVEYVQDDIIKPNLNLYTSAYRKDHKQTPTKKGVSNDKFPTKYLDENKYWFYTLSTKDEVQHRLEAKEDLNNTYLCYWHLNNINNQIAWDANNSYILQEGEYFFYTDVSLSGIVSYGSGTKLVINQDMLTWNNGWKINKINDVAELIDNGLSSFADNFTVTKFTNTHSMSIIEQQIITLTEGDKIVTTQALSISDNIFEAISTDNVKAFRYVFANETEEHALPSIEIPWSLRATLNISSGPELGQTLSNNQTIECYNESDSLLYTLTSGMSFQLNTLKQINGGVHVDLSYIDLALQQAYPSMYVYKQDKNNVIVDGKPLSILKENYYDIVGQTGDKYLIPIPNIGKDAYIMFKLNKINVEDDSNITIKAYSDTSTVVNNALIRTNSLVESASTSINLVEFDNLTIIKIDKTKNVNYIEIDVIKSNKDIVAISNVRYVEDINPYLYHDISKLSLDSIKSYMKTNYPLSYQEFYQTGYIDGAKEIELSLDYPLDFYSSFFSSNNIASKWTIPQIDFENSRITIARSSMN